MKKAFRFLKGIVKGARDVSPVPSKEAEEKLKSMKMVDPDSVFELMGQKITARGVMAMAVFYVIDQLFNLNFFG